MAGKKQKSLTLDEKVELIRASEIQKLPAKALQELFKCGKTTVYDTLQRKAQILEYWMEGLGSGKRKIRTKNEKINRLTWEWFTMARSKNIPIDGPMLQNKAKELAKQQGDFSFKASNGWLQSFKNRHNIRWKEARGELNNVIRSVKETCGEFNYFNVRNVQEMSGEFHNVEDKTVQETCGELNNINVRSVQDMCGEVHNVKDEIVEETCDESIDVKDEIVQETCGEFHNVKDEIVQETCEESNDVNVGRVREICGESHNGDIHTESDDNIVSGLDTENINETIPSLHTYSEALQYVTQLQKFALTANNPELLQSFSISKNLIEQELVRRKIKMEKILDTMW